MPWDNHLVTGRVGHMRGKVKDAAQELVPSMYGIHQIPVENDARKSFIADLLTKMNFIFGQICIDTLLSLQLCANISSLVTNPSVAASMIRFPLLSTPDQRMTQDFVLAEFSDEYDLHMSLIQSKIHKEDGSGKLKYHALMSWLYREVRIGEGSNIKASSDKMPELDFDGMDG
ncbi:hypothetical protein GGU10DRAFT_335402 [Lentinula aff. detonsa]|uniref:DUF6532 domain-containing protein n=1 Tax=Lentinula aff. detonsa TaxID=2804958 RepID=A0AA38KM48_9AGAR|nr:hypothetical protein GGU10DRAFT_335402 [Lentinula aff. detonsa]